LLVAYGRKCINGVRRRARAPTPSGEQQPKHAEREVSACLTSRTIVKQSIGFQFELEPAAAVLLSDFNDGAGSKPAPCSLTSSPLHTLGKVPSCIGTLHPHT